MDRLFIKDNCEKNSKIMHFISELLLVYIYIYISGVGRCQKVCVWGGGGGGEQRHVIYVPLVKN